MHSHTFFVNTASLNLGKRSSLAKERCGYSLRGRGLKQEIFQLRDGHSTTELSLPQWNVRRQCHRCQVIYDVPLGCC